MSTQIEVVHLSRFYGDLCAVRDVSFTLDKGEVLGFLGPNGAGKSTTMKMICGNLSPTEGEIRINGIDIIDQPKLAKSKLGFLPETPPLYRELTVLEFLTFCARLHGLKGAAVTAAVDRACERCGLTAMRQRLIANLSKGYQQRVGIAQAILHNPDVIILDEPTVGLDPIQIREIRQLIRELGQDHSVILSTHILPEVQESCTRVQIIHQGELVLNDSIDGLDARMQSSSLTIKLRQPPTASELEALPSLLSVESLGHNGFRLTHPLDQNPAEQLAEMAVNCGWGLLELTPEKRSMEQIFVELTSPEAAPHD